MSRTKRLLGAVAVVTDAVSAVGVVISDRLASEGARLLIVDPDGIGAAWRAKEINLLVTGLDPNFSDVGEDPWGAKRSAASFQSDVSDTQSLLVILQTAVDTFNAPVDVIFDASGSIDVRFLRELACTGIHLENRGKDGKRSGLRGSYGLRTLITITSGERTSLLSARQTDTCGSKNCLELSAGDMACAHVFCGDTVLQQLREVYELPVCGHGLQKGCIDIQCRDVFAPIAHLVSSSMETMSVLDLSEDELADWSAKLERWCCNARGSQNQLLPIRLWFDADWLPDVGEKTPLGNRFSISTSHQDLFSGESRGGGSSLDCENRIGQCHGSSRSLIAGRHANGPVMPRWNDVGNLRALTPTNTLALDSHEGDVLNEWGAYCGFEFSDHHPLSLDDKYALSVGVNAMKYTMRYLVFGYIIVTFAMPKVWGLYNNVN